MARPRLIQDEDLLRAARETFLEQGYAAPTVSIARRAGVSEGTLFKRFASKEELFAAAMGITNYGQWRQTLLSATGTGEVQRNLELAALHILAESAGLIGNIFAVFARGVDPGHNPMFEQLKNTVIADQEVFQRYLRQEMQLGRIRPVDVEVVSAGLHGTLMAYMQLYQAPLPGGLPLILGEQQAGAEAGRPCMGRLGPGAPPGIDPARYVRSLIELLWPGLKP